MGLETFHIYQAGGYVSYLGGYHEALGCSRVLVDTVVAERSPSTEFTWTHTWPTTHDGNAATYASFELVVKDSEDRTVAVGTAIVSSGGSPIVPSVTVTVGYGECDVQSPELSWCVSQPGTYECDHIDLVSESSESSSSRSSSSVSSESSVLPHNVGISYWQVYQWPDVFIVGWVPSGPSSSSSSSESSPSESSLSTGPFADGYYARGFTILSANGCYGRMGTWENERPVYSNGTYYLKFGGEAYPRWFVQQITSLAIHYWSGVVNEPTNLGAAYTAQVGLGSGGFMDEGCPSSSSESSPSSVSRRSSSSSESSPSTRSSSSSRSSSSRSSSSSSFYANLPVELASYVSDCRGMDSISNPATGAGVGMAIDGFMDEEEFPVDDSMVARGGLVRTAANMGRIWCGDASRLFSMRYGMVSMTIRPPLPVSGGVYEPLAGMGQSANPEMVLFCVNPGETHLAQPGLYAALTPRGIEFTVWSSGSATTVIDSSTDVAAGEDVTLPFAWDYSRRIIADGQRASMAILVGDLDPVAQVVAISSSSDGAGGGAVATAWSADAIVPSSLASLYVLGSANSESSEEAPEDVPAGMSIGDMPGGMNGLVGIPIRRIEIYKEPYGVRMAPTPQTPQLAAFPANSRSEFEVGFVATGMRWIGVSVGDTEFKPATYESVSLLDVGTGGPLLTRGVDAGGMEDDAYPEAPIGLPVGVDELKGR